MARAIATIREALCYQPQYAEYFAENAALFNRVVAFYFSCIQAQMKGRIFRYSKYKAWNKGGIITSRINPRNTSRECHRCHATVIRYSEGQPVEGYTPGAALCLCPQCHMRDHADRNASLRIGQRLLERYAECFKEKPPTAVRRAGRVSKETGVVLSQDAKRQRGPSISEARHGERNAHGTAQQGTLWMDERP